MSGTRQGYLIFPLLFNTVLEVLTREIWQQKVIKAIQIGKEKVKVSLFAVNMILFCTQKTLKSPPKNLLETINKCNKVAGHKINVQKSTALLYTNNETSEKEIKKQFLLQLQPKEKTPRNTLNKGCEKPIH